MVKSKHGPVRHLPVPPRPPAPAPQTKAAPVNLGQIQTADGKVWVEPEVSPERAAELLKKLHPGQRALRERHAESMTNALKEGRFVWTADPIRFDANGHLIDGQHRLTACVRSEMPLRNVVFATIYDHDSIQYIDSGAAPRSLHDIRKISGKPAVGTAVVSAIVLEFCDFSQKDTSLLTKVERSELVDEFPFVEDVTKLYRIGDRKVRLTAGPLAGAIRCMRANRSRAYLFFSTAFDNSPVLDGELCPQTKLLADFLVNDSVHRSVRGDRGAKRIDPFEGAYKAITAYNAWREDRVLQRLQLPKDKTVGVPKAVK